MPGAEEEACPPTGASTAEVRHSSGNDDQEAAAASSGTLLAADTAAGRLPKPSHAFGNNNSLEQFTAGNAAAAAAAASASASTGGAGVATTINSRGHPPAAAITSSSCLPAPSLPLPHPQNNAARRGATPSTTGVIFPPVMLVPSALLPPGVGAVRPSTAIEAQVHASIKGGARFAVPPLGSGASSSMMPPAPEVMTPDVFLNRRLRSGKWIKEEELYADVLIERFEGGTAPDCPKGVTLRAYLSKKLHCAPMRISKKYAGKGIGKMVFVPKVVGPDAGGTCPMEDRQRREEQLKEREDRFYKAAFRSNDFLGIPYGFVFGPPPANPIVIPAHPPQIPFGVAAAMHVPFKGVSVHPAASIGSIPILPQVQLPILPVASAAAPPHPLGPSPLNHTAPAVAAEVAMPAPGPGTVIKPRPSPPAVPPVPSQSSGPVALNEQTLKLHQSYLNALQQHPNLFSVPAAPLRETSGPIESNNGSTTSQVASGHRVAKPLQWRPPQPLRPGNALFAAKSAPSAGAQSNASATAEATVHHQPPLRDPPPRPPAASPALLPHSPMDPLKDFASNDPDFLSGFDRVALSLKPSPSDTEKLASLPQPQGDLHCSPTFTSRSFDDFHRFLGQDLVHLGSPARPPASQELDFSRPRAGSESAPPMVRAMDGPSNLLLSPASIGSTRRPSAPALSLGVGGESSSRLPPNGDGPQLLTRSNSHDVNSMFSADSYCLFASAAVAASNQHAAYSAPPGALFGVTHVVKGTNGEEGRHSSHGHVLMKRGRADTFDIESTMNIVSAHVGGLQRQQPSSFDSMTDAERTRTFHCSTVTLPTPRETLLERMYGLRRENENVQLVSGSEPSSSSATTETESGNDGSSSGNASPNDSEDFDPSGHSGDSSTSDSDMMSDDDSDSQLLQQSPKSKRARLVVAGTAEAVAAPGAGNQAYTL